MKTIRIAAIAALLALASFAFGQSGRKASSNSDSPRERLIGAWHLVSIDEPDEEGGTKHITDRTGQLVYTRDGHISVQIMYPPSEANVSNEYVLKGYEASFGSYDMDESVHTVTHHVQGSVTRGLVGRDLVRAY